MYKLLVCLVGLERVHFGVGFEDPVAFGVTLVLVPNAEARGVVNSLVVIEGKIGEEERFSLPCFPKDHGDSKLFVAEIIPEVLEPLLTRDHLGSSLVRHDKGYFAGS